VTPSLRCVFLVMAGLAGACREAAPPAPVSAPPATAPGGLRPLTSRDGGAPAQDNPASARADPDPAGESVSGTVTVAPTLAKRIQPTDVLYLIARNAKTSGVVAVRREEGVRFPFAFSLTAADVMMEGTPFAGPLDVTARLSKTGDAIAAKGDLEGKVSDVAAGASGLTITLDSVRQ